MLSILKIPLYFLNNEKHTITNRREIGFLCKRYTQHDQYLKANDRHTGTLQICLQQRVHCYKDVH